MRKIRGVPKKGECSYSRVEMRRLWKWEIERAEVACPECGAKLKLRRLSPGVQGEPRVSPFLPPHKDLREKGADKG